MDPVTLSPHDTDPSKDALLLAGSVGPYVGYTTSVPFPQSKT